MITVAALSPSLDITFLVDDLRLGAIHRPTAVHRVAGGKSFNLARAAACVGGSVATVAVLGGTTGDFLAAELRSSGIGVRAVRSPAETRTCVSIAAADRGDLTEIYPYAPEVPGPVWDEFRRAVSETLSPTAPVDDAAVGPGDAAPPASTTGGWLAVNGGAPQGLDPDVYATMITIAHRVGVRVAVDTHGPALAAALTARPELIKVNRFEAAELLGMPADDADLATMITELTARTGGAVIITDGRAGAVGSTPDGAAVRVRLPDDIDGHFPVGSGDSFLGGWLAATDRGADAAEALRLASGCGAANALVPGPGTFDRATAEQIADRTAVSPLGRG